MRKIFGLALVLTAASSVQASGSLFSAYNFDGDLTPSVNNGGVPAQIVTNKNVLYTVGDSTYGEYDSNHLPAGVQVPYVTQQVGGVTKSVLKVSQNDALDLVLGLPANGGNGNYPYQYTIVQDIRMDAAKAFTLFDPTANSMGYNREAWIDAQGHATFGDLSQSTSTGYDVNSNPARPGGVGAGSIDVTQWHRYAVSVDITAGIASLYVDGNLAVSVTGVDSKYRLGKFNNATTFLGSRLNDGVGGTTIRDGYGATAYLSSIQAYDGALSASEVQALGSLAPVPEPASIAALGLGAVVLVRRRRRG